MKGTFLAVGVCLALVATHGVFGDEAVKAEDIGVTLVGMGGVDKKMVTDVAEHLRKNLQIPIHIRNVSGPVPVGYDPVINAVKSQTVPGDLCAIALLKTDANWPRMQIMLMDRCAIVVPARLEPLQAKNAADKALRWDYRIKKECIRAACTIFGLPSCPFPRCALLQQVNDRQLDAKGYNQCPPCYERTERALRSLGAVVGPRPAK